MPSQPKSVVELKFEPEEYLCTWHVPRLDGTTAHLPGSIEVAANRPPCGTIYGNVPLESDSGNGETSFRFPQIREYSALKFTLANGGVGLVLDAELNLLISQGFISGAAATMAKGGSLLPWQEHTTKAAAPGEGFLFDAAEIQLGGLDSLMGVHPIGEKTYPHKAGADGKFSWTAETNPESEIEWAVDGERLKAWYPAKVNTFDFYNVSIRFAPLLRVNLAKGISLFDVLQYWLEPIRSIASIATGSSQSISYFAVRPCGQDSQGVSAQVFGTGLMQAPFESSAEQVRRDASVLRCGEDGVSLLDLVTAWRSLEAEQHPLIETYAGMLHAKDSHPRSRFLLLIQSLEGMHGHDTQNQFEERRLKHKAKRDELIATVATHLSAKQKRFLKQSLTREPARSLEDALAAAFDLPAEFVETKKQLEESRLVASLVAEEGCTPLGALRIARNGLAHGTRGFPPEDLHQVNDVLDRLVRVHALRLLGCPEAVLTRLAKPVDR